MLLSRNLMLIHGTDLCQNITPHRGMLNQSLKSRSSPSPHQRKLQLSFPNFHTGSSSSTTHNMRKSLIPWQWRIPRKWKRTRTCPWKRTRTCPWLSPRIPTTTSHTLTTSLILILTTGITLTTSLILSTSLIPIPSHIQSSISPITSRLITMLAPTIHIRSQTMTSLEALSAKATPSITLTL